MNAIRFLNKWFSELTHKKENNTFFVQPSFQSYQQKPFAHAPLSVLNQLQIQKVEGAVYQPQESNSEFEAAHFIATNNEDEPEDIVEPPETGQIENVEGSLGNFQQVYTLQNEIETNIESPIEEETHEEEGLVVSRHHSIEHEDLCKSPDSVIEVSQFKDNENVEFMDQLHENESESEDFQIVDGVHVTADTDSNEEVTHINTYVEDNAQNIMKLQENVLQSSESKIKNSNNKISNKDNKNLMYYVIKHPEKENVGAMTQQVMKNALTKTNPRSVLKSSYAFLEQKKEKIHNLKNDKKAIKNRENSQARILHNYIAKTTILHAPVRQERLPRKQTIKPVVRADEEIIVQEVVVSSNGIIETSEDGVVKSKVPLEPTEFVQVTDSDEDYDYKQEQKRKRKKKKRRQRVQEIVISDSDDGTSDVVQIDLSAESEQEKEPQKGEGKTLDDTEINTPGSIVEKRKRGRPKKRLSSSLSESTCDTSTSKKFKSSNDSESTDLSPLKAELQSIKTKWKCESCPKVFPSQGGLKTHMQYHNYHPSSASKLESFKKPLFTSSAHKCKICFETFKNNYLLIKHTKEHNETNKFECGICKKLFSDQFQLNNHKRSHIKEQMFNTTTLPKHSPKRKSVISVPKTDQKFKCIFCTRVFSTQFLLNNHSLTHERFSCSRCTVTFISKLALEDHVQNKCVKKPKTPTRRPLFKTGSSIKRTPLPSRTSLRRKSVTKICDKKLNSSSSSNNDKKKFNTSVINLKCDSCSMIFKSHKNLFKHKVLKHGLETPDKNVNRDVKEKESNRYCSVPVSSRLQMAFSSLRTLKK